MAALTGSQIQALGIVKNGIIYKHDDGKMPSYGLDGCLYTFRCNRTDTWLDTYELEPFESLSLVTLEQVHMPVDCCGILTLKSTYSRKGIILVTNSPVDPGYTGNLTMRLFNSSYDNTVNIDLHGGIMQMIVLRMEDAVQPYNGRWQQK